MEELFENSKSKEKSNIISDLFQNQNITNDGNSHISGKIYDENLNKNLYPKKQKEESISLCDNTLSLSSIIDYINHQINGMIDALKNFQKYAKEKKVTSLKEKSEMNNKTAEEINDKENKTTDEGKNKIQNSDIDVLDDIYEEFEKLNTDIYSSFETIKNKIKEINNSKEPSSILKEDTTIANIISDIDKDLTIKTEEPNDLKFEPKYNYFKSETGNILEIRIEVPGKAKMDANYEVVENETIITFKGNKMKDEEPNRFSDNLFNKRFFGKFEFKIPLKTEDFCIVKSKEGYQQKNGIFIFQFILAPKGEITSASTEEC